MQRAKCVVIAEETA